MGLGTLSRSIGVLLTNETIDAIRVVSTRPTLPLRRFATRFVISADKTLLAREARAIAAEADVHRPRTFALPVRTLLAFKAGGTFVRLLTGFALLFRRLPAIVIITAHQA